MKGWDRFDSQCNMGMSSSKMSKQHVIFALLLCTSIEGWMKYFRVRFREIRKNSVRRLDTGQQAKVQSSLMSGAQARDTSPGERSSALHAGSGL